MPNVLNHVLAGSLDSTIFLQGAMGAHCARATLEMQQAMAVQPRQIVLVETRSVQTQHFFRASLVVCLFVQGMCTCTSHR